jgi:hypothetical protein
MTKTRRLGLLRAALQISALPPGAWPGAGVEAQHFGDVPDAAPPKRHFEGDFLNRRVGTPVRIAALKLSFADFTEIILLPAVFLPFFLMFAPSQWGHLTWVSTSNMPPRSLDLAAFLLLCQHTFLNSTEEFYTTFLFGLYVTQYKARFIAMLHRFSLQIPHEFLREMKSQPTQ